MLLGWFWAASNVLQRPVTRRGRQRDSENSESPPTCPTRSPLTSLLSSLFAQRTPLFVAEIVPRCEMYLAISADYKLLRFAYPFLLCWTHCPEVLSLMSPGRCKDS